MIEPYFQNKNCILYHSKYQDVMEQIGEYQLLLTDPPYEMNNQVNKNSYLSLKKYENDSWQDIIDGFDVSDLKSLLKKCVPKKNAYVFCSNKQISKLMTYGEQCNYSTNLLVWHKTNAVPFCHGVWRSDLEFIVQMRECGSVFNDTNCQIKSKLYSSLCVHSEIHPTQKPKDLIRKFVLISSNENDTIFDPFAGSGTTGIVALENNRKCILIEKEEKYCEYIAKSINNIDRLGLNENSILG